MIFDCPCGCGARVRVTIDAQGRVNGYLVGSATDPKTTQEEPE